MKRLFFLLFPVLFLFDGCLDNDKPLCLTCETFSEAFVIGYDPCTANPDTGKAAGYLIAIPSQGDTVMTYNFPDSLYKFPKEYFVYYQFWHFFPDSARDDFSVKLKYRLANEEEKKWPICRGDIITPKLGYAKKQIIIISVTK